MSTNKQEPKKPLLHQPARARPGQEYSDIEPSFESAPTPEPEKIELSAEEAIQRWTMDKKKLADEYAEGKIYDNIMMGLANFATGVSEYIAADRGRQPYRSNVDWNQIFNQRFKEYQFNQGLSTQELEAKLKTLDRRDRFKAAREKLAQSVKDKAEKKTEATRKEAKKDARYDTDQAQKAETKSEKKIKEHNKAVADAIEALDPDAKGDREAKFKAAIDKLKAMGIPVPKKFGDTAYFKFASEELEESADLLRELFISPDQPAPTQDKSKVTRIKGSADE